MKVRIQLRSPSGPDRYEAEAGKRTKTKRKAHYMRSFRKKLKETNPEQYKTFRQLECLRLQDFRANMTDDRRLTYNEKAKLRMRELRKRNKEERESEHQKPPTTARTMTRSMEERDSQQRDTWRLQKKKH